MSQYHRLLSIGAHPLDAEIMGGPFLLRYAARGAACTFVHVTKGRLTDPTATEEQKRAYDEALHNEIAEAAARLNGNCYEMNYLSADLPDTAAFIAKLKAYFVQEKTDCIITHARGTLHPRHYYTYETVTEAVRQLRSEGHDIRLFYGENCEDLAGFTPTVYLTQTQQELEQWLHALQAYSIFKGKVNDMPYYEYYHAMARIRSIEAGGHGYAKAYMHAALSDTE